MLKSKSLSPMLKRGLVTLLVFTLWNCGDDRKDEPLTPVLSGIIRDSESNEPIADANIIVIDRETNAPVGNVISGDNGAFSIELDTGSYSLEVTAQGYYAYPRIEGSAMIITLPTEISTEIQLLPNSNTDGTGGIFGRIELDSEQGLAGALIIAVQGQQAQSTTTNPQGEYRLYNLEPGAWTIEVYKTGYVQADSQVVQVAANRVTNPPTLDINEFVGATVQGQVSFLATNAKQIDVTLIHPITRKAIPGLSVFTDSNNGYQLLGVPPGDYIAWASYGNDSMVMDPDWIRKSGLPRLLVQPNDSLLDLNFSCTGAITLLSPTNPMDSIYPVVPDTLPIEFQWLKQSSYASAAQYIISVYNQQGDLVWGGYDSTLTALHEPIEALNTPSVTWNFDGSALSDTLPPGRYQWKVYALKISLKQGVEERQLLSASEDLLGLFEILPP